MKTHMQGCVGDAGHQTQLKFLEFLMLSFESAQQKKEASNEYANI